MVWNTSRPHIHPLLAPNGGILTIDAPADHPWHHGLWFTIKYVNGENFWEEYGEFGRLVTESVVVDGATTTAVIDWQRPEGADTVLRETRTIRVSDVEGGCYYIDWTEALTPIVDVTLDRTPFTTWGGYGGLTFRGAPDFTDTQLVSDTGMYERRLGEPGAWCAINGIAHDGEGRAREAGVLIIDHPRNLNAPVPWYASTRAATYGDGWANFVNAAVLWDGPVNVARGETLVLCYRVIVHDDHWDGQRCATAAAAWAAELAAEWAGEWAGE